MTFKKYPEKECHHCGTTFKPNSHKHYYCSTQCSNDVKRISREKKKATIPAVNRLCVVCALEFTVRKGFYKICSTECQTHYKKFRHITRSKTAKYQKLRRECMLKANYGITTRDYELMLLEQGGTCKICDKTPDDNKQYLAVDHCHTTGKVRGILCSKCNSGIGLLQDNYKLVQAAAEYLKESQGEEEN